MTFPAPDPLLKEQCERCEAPIEEPRLAVGLRSCWPCGARDPHSPPWDIGPDDVGAVAS